MLGSTLARLFLVASLAALLTRADEGWCDCAEKGKPTHFVDILEEAANVLLVEVRVTDPKPLMRQGKSGPGLRMVYGADVIKTIKGCLRPKSVTIKQLVFPECPPVTLQGQYYISGAMGSAASKAKGGGGKPNVFYLDPCGITLTEETPLRQALNSYGNDCSQCGAGTCVPCFDNGIVSPLQQCEDVCASSQCTEEGGKCMVSRCGPLCKATWVSNETAPKILCPSGLPSGAIEEAIRNLQEREKLLIAADEAYKLNKPDEAAKDMAEVVKLSSGGEMFRVPPETTTTPEPETPPPPPEKPVGLQGLIQLVKENPAVGHALDTFRREAAQRLGQDFKPMFDNASRRLRVKKRLRSLSRRMKDKLRRRLRRRRRSRRNRRRRSRSRRRRNSSRRRRRSRRRQGRRRGSRSTGRRGSRTSGQRNGSGRSGRPRSSSMGNIPVPPRQRSRSAPPPRQRSRSGGRGGRGGRKNG